jgi:hypothetical protein
MGKVVNVFFTQSAGNAGHIASVIVAVLRFEVFEGFHHVIKILTRYFGNLILTFELSLMAHGAQSFIGFGNAFFDLFRIGDEAFIGQFLSCKIIGQLLHIGFAEPCGHRRHHGVITTAFLEIAQLQIQVACILTRQTRRTLGILELPFSPWHARASGCLGRYLCHGCLSAQ